MDKDQTRMDHIPWRRWHKSQASRLRYQGRVDGLEEGKAEAVAVLLHAQTQAATAHQPIT